MRVPLSRSDTKSVHSVLALGGPTSSIPEVRLLMSAAPLNADSAPKEPRLSPKAISLGRWSPGRCDHASYTWLNSSRPASWARSLSTRNDNQLGRYEYCMPTSAVSPLYMYSSGSTALRLTQPVPVVVITHSTLRENAPV